VTSATLNRFSARSAPFPLLSHALIISSKLSKLRINKAPDVDKIGSQNFSGKCGFINYTFTVYIYRKSLESGIVPGDWKKANVTPIFKKGDKSLSSNYSPVILTSQVCKVLEEYVMEHIKHTTLLKNHSMDF